MVSQFLSTADIWGQIVLRGDPVPCLVGCWAASLGPTFLMPRASPSPSRDNQKCLQTLQVSPGGAKWPPVENCWLKYYTLCLYYTGGRSEHRMGWGVPLTLSFLPARPGLGTPPSITQPPTAHLGLGSIFTEPQGTQMFGRLVGPWAPKLSARKPQLLWLPVSSRGEELLVEGEKAWVPGGVNIQGMSAGRPLSNISLH